MKKTRVAVCGAHSTGKTSLIAELVARHPNTYVIDGIMRQLRSEGYGVGPETTESTLKQYVIRQFDREVAAARSDWNLVLSDRVLVDGLAYVLTARGQTPLTRADIDFFKAIARRQLDFYEVVAYLPVEFPVVPDGVRPLDEAHRSAVDAALQRLLAELAGDRLTAIRGSLSSRVVQLERVLGS